MYKINGTNLFDSCGFLADSSRDSVNSFERPNNPAEVFSHKWENGVVDWDLTTVPGDEPRLFKITGTIFATSEADYNLKKAALETIVKVQKATIYVQEIDETVNAKFKGFTAWSRLTPIKGSSQIVTKVSMEFDELLGLIFPTSAIYYGTSSSVPITAADVQALTAVPFTSTVEVQTGTFNRIISLALQSDHGITSVTDLDNPYFPAVTYTLSGTVTIGTTNYKIYSLQLGAPYSTNHRHKFTIA
jgi:hypothetical protein